MSPSGAAISPTRNTPTPLSTCSSHPAWPSPTRPWKCPEATGWRRPTGSDGGHTQAFHHLSTRPVARAVRGNGVAFSLSCRLIPPPRQTNACQQPAESIPLLLWNISLPRPSMGCLSHNTGGETMLKRTTVFTAIALASTLALGADPSASQETAASADAQSSVGISASQGAVSGSVHSDSTATFNTRNVVAIGTHGDSADQGSAGASSSAKQQGSANGNARIKGSTGLAINGRAQTAETAVRQTGERTEARVASSLGRAKVATSTAVDNAVAISNGAATTGDAAAEAALETALGAAAAVGAAADLAAGVQSEVRNAVAADISSQAGDGLTSVIGSSVAAEVPREVAADISGQTGSHAAQQVATEVANGVSSAVAADIATSVADTVADEVKTQVAENVTT